MLKLKISKKVVNSLLAYIYSYAYVSTFSPSLV